MTKIRTLQIYRGTTAQNNAYTGSAGELTMDTTTNELRLHDGSTAGGHIIGSGGSGSYHPDLFDHKWADHICNDVQWLRSDTFSWQSGAVYQVAYQHLVDDIDGKTLQSETVAGTTIQFYLADNGHKICPASEESNVTAIYNATGVAWYYIIDTTNQRFKLPRINPDSEELAYQISAFGDGDYLRFMSSDGSYKGSLINSHSESLGSGTGWLRTYNTGGALVNLGDMKLSDVKGQSGIKVEKDTIFSGKKYLYFYVGNFTQTALENTAGVTTEVLNTKVTVGHEVVEFQAPTAANNYTWYRKYADGWVEQGGQTTPTEYGSGGTSVTLPVEMANTYYQVSVTQITSRRDGIGSTVIPAGYASSTTQIFICGRYVQVAESTPLGWVVYGMAA